MRKNPYFPEIFYGVSLLVFDNTSLTYLQGFVCAPSSVCHTIPVMWGWKTLFITIYYYCPLF